MKKAIFLLLLLPNFIFAFNIELSEIMKGNEFIGHQPENIVWSPDSKEIYFQWKHKNENYSPYYAYNIAAKAYRKLNSAQLRELPVEGYTLFEKGEGAIYKKNNALIIWTKKRVRETLLCKSEPFQIYRAISPDEFILREKNNFVHYSLSPFKITQLSNFIDGFEPQERGKSQDFLEKQQADLFQIIVNTERRDLDRKNYYDSITRPFAPAIFLNGKNLGFNEISPDNNFLLFRLDENPENKNTELIDYITENGYSKKINARPKVGSKDPTHELFLFSIPNDTLLKIQTKHLTGIQKKPEFLKLYGDNETLSEEPKNITFHQHGFNTNSTYSLVEIKSYDNKDRWICILNLKNYELIEIDHQHDEAWIGGPGIWGWNMVPGNCAWISENAFIYQSEESGFSHLYSYSLLTKEKTTLTSGKFEIHKTQLNKDKSKIYLSSNESHPGNREIQVIDLKTKKRSFLTTKDGNHEWEISPNETGIAFLYSTKNQPWELFTSPLSTSLTYEKITHSTSNVFERINWIDPEVISITANDGVTLKARIYEPSPSSKNGAAVFFVHGAGYLQNAHNWWSTYYREYMFHNLLVELGYTVLDLDYRASEGYGRDFRTGIYRHMGGKDLSDYVDARNWLIQNKEIDSSRIGIYGGSYGGFLTLMALLTEPGKFKCGAAIRSVTDWAHYNHAYTSNILNTPDLDPDAFKISSPIYFAENLEDRLLMLHGMMDDNVQYQDVVRLSQRFIELGKSNWDLIGYPIEPHGFKETSSWVDEYGRILKMFEEELR